MESFKETLTQLFSCEYCRIFKNSFIYRTPPVAASIPFYFYTPSYSVPSTTKINYYIVNPFPATGLFLYPLKILQNL